MFRKAITACEPDQGIIEHHRPGSSATAKMESDESLDTARVAVQGQQPTDHCAEPPQVSNRRSLSFLLQHRVCCTHVLLWAPCHSCAQTISSDALFMPAIFDSSTTSTTASQTAVTPSAGLHTSTTTKHTQSQVCLSVHHAMQSLYSPET